MVYQDGAVVYAGPSEGCPDLDGETQIIDGHGHFVMPGMVESHAHLSYTNNGPLELDKSPVEEVVIKTIQNARIMLGSGLPLPSVLARCIASTLSSNGGSSAAMCSDRDCWLEDAILGQRAVTLTSTRLRPTEN